MHKNNRMRNNNHHLNLLFQLLLLLCCHTTRHDWLHHPSGILLVRAVLRGDEQFAEIGGGRFWVFTSRGIHVIDPEECTVEHTIRSDANGQALPSQWSEGVYMEYTTESNPNSNPNNPQAGNQPKKGFILINSGENFQGKSGQSEGSKSEVIVIDTSSGSKQPVHARIEVGPALGHAYSVFHRNQVRTFFATFIFYFALLYVMLDKLSFDCLVKKEKKKQKTPHTNAIQLKLILLYTFPVALEPLVQFKTFITAPPHNRQQVCKDILNSYYQYLSDTKTIFWLIYSYPFFLSGKLLFI